MSFDLEKARERLRADDKIGPEDDVVHLKMGEVPTTPRSWQITEERKVALRHLIAVNCPHGHCNAVEAIRAMLQEAGQE